ncbi:methyltransferase domain-containing protein [Actinophytocola xanthii]|uniref:Methyltransferase type 11 n=1 Tax=Actinophytocola xanthii TaxID=1912961 RepID=A0A1Q8C5G2_9PSEU|nr:methyltransferase domain-containing protein [Actinophytocola xanthii]OLF09605.1 methyltransferase type 11 [Actinophytocola xanthii]
MSTVAGNVAEFTAVDEAPDAAWFIDFMDAANSLPAYGEIRARLAGELGELTGRAVLDVGCGTGDDTRELASLVGDGGRVVGVDLSVAMVAEARRRAAGTRLPIEFRVGDLARLELPDGSFDRVRAKLVLMHCADIEAAAAALVRVTRPGGRLAVFDYDFDTATVDHPDVDATREVVRCASDGHPNNWSGRQLARRFRDLGLRDVRVTPLTALLPFEFFHRSLSGRLASAQAGGDLRMSAGELRAWWRPLARAADENRFFGSLTGFVLGGTR